jgi:putative endonuclease
MAQHNIVGSFGEEQAAEYLKKKGYSICHTNWHSGHYELDIVAVSPGEEPELVIVEVKTRSTGRFGSPEDAVDTRKILRTVHAANHYIRLNDIMIPPRFDIIGIKIVDGRPEIDHIIDAYYPPLG